MKSRKLRRVMFMRYTKLYLTLVMFFLFFFALPNSVFAFPKYKVALLPIINTANLKTTEVSDLITYKIHRKLRFPFYEFIPNSEVNRLLQTVSTQNQLISPDQKTLSFLSQTLSADIVIAVEVVRARADQQYTFSSWDENDQTIETINVLLKYYAYSAKDNQYYFIKAAKYTSEQLNFNSGLLYAVQTVTDELLQKSPFKTIPESVLTK